MEQKTYEIKDYSIFENAINTNNKMNSNIEKYNETLSSNKDSIYNSNVFDGPIATICQEEISKIEKEITEMRGKFTPISNTLAIFFQNYQEADTKAEETISSVK